MPRFAVLVAECEHCHFHFYNENGWKLHQGVCDKDPKVIAAAERMPELVALTPAELAEREAVMNKPLHVDWQQIDREILEEQAREAIRATQTEKGTPPVSVVKTTSKKKKAAEPDAKPAGLSQWT